MANAWEAYKKSNEFRLGKANRNLISRQLAAREEALWQTGDEADAKSSSEAGSDFDLIKALTTPAESGYFEGTSFLPSSPQDFVRSLGYQAERAGAGLLGAVEGVTDFAGAALGKGISGLFTLGGLLPETANSQIGEDIANHYLNTSPTQDWKDSINERYQPSIGEQRLGGITETVAQMLPAIGIGTAVSAGSSAINATNAASKGTAASKALFGLQAAGSGAQQAASEGASTGQALTYGALSGLLETSIESLAGGIPGMGKGMLSEVADKVASNPLVTRALDIAGEGGEEALSTIITPYIQRAVYDADAENATADEIAESAIMGMVAAGVLQGGLVLPTAVSDTVSDVRNVRQAIGSNQDIINRANQRLSSPGQVMADFMDAGLPLPTVISEKARNRQAEQNNRLNLPGGNIQQENVQTDNRLVLPGNEQNNTAPESRAVIRDYQRAEHHGEILDTVRANLDRVSSLRPVAELTGQEFQKTPGDNRSLRQRIAEFFNSIGNKVTRQDLGEIELNTSGVRDSLAHGYGRLKAATFASLPQVIENGTLIAHNGPYEGHNYDSYIISAPVNVGGETVYVGALVIKDTNQRYKLHEVLTASESGTPLFQSESTSQGADVPLRNDMPLGEPEGSPTNNSILPGGQDVNIQAVSPDSSVGAAQTGLGSESLPETAVGAEKISPWVQFQASSDEFIPEGANAARPVDVPTTDPQGRRIRRTASTAMGAKAIPDEVVGDIQNMVLRGELSYDRVSDKSSIDRAIKTIQDKGYQGALEEFRTAVSKGVISKDMATLGQQLLINAANAGDSRTTAELLSLYAQMETTAGQAVQAASILRKLDPSDQLYAAQRAVSDLEKVLRKNYKDLDIIIDQNLLDEFAAQTTQEGRDAVMDRIYQNVADQVPSTWKDKWNAWRYPV